MATTLKCPNPSCPYLFDPSTVPAGVVLACPRCTMRFMLGAGAAQAQAAQAATYPGHADRPAPAPRGPASPFGEMTPETAKPDGAEGPRLPVRGSTLQTVLLVGVAAVALAGAGVAVWYKATHKPEEVKNDAATAFPDLNLSIEEPAGAWTQDGTTQAALGPPFFRVYKRDNPDATIALGARSYPERDPRPGELKQVLQSALASLLTADTLVPKPVPDGTTWLGRPVTGFNFRGQLRNGSVVEGEAYHVAHKGYGYWFIAWTGENQIYAEQKGTFARVREQSKLLDPRSGWSPKQADAAAFRNNVVGYTILDAEDVWREETDEAWVKAVDPKADKYFTAKVKRKGRDFALEAEMVVFVLDGSANPLEQGRKYVEDWQNREVESRGRTTFVAHTEDTSFDEPNQADGNAPYVLLKGRNERSDATRLWAVSAIKAGGKTVVACAWCPFTREDREQFERKFVVLVRSLRAEN